MVEIKNPLPRIAAIIMSLIFASTLGFYVIEGGKESFMDCLYMTVITLSTVGYREIFDVSAHPVLRLYTIVVLTVGVGILLYSLSAFTAFIVEGHFSGMIRRRRMMKEISNLQGHTIVCGGGDTGYYVVEELLKCGRSIVLIDKSEENLELCKRLGPLHYIIGDATDDENLKDANIETAQGVVIALPSDKDNLYIVMTARILNPSIRIISIGQHEHTETKMRKAGADGIVSPNAIGGLRLASEMIRPATVEFLDQMLRGQNKVLRVGEINIKEGTSWVNQTIAECNFSRKYNLLIMSVRKSPGAPFQYNPPSSQVLEAGNVLIVMGEVGEIRRVEEST